MAAIILVALGVIGLGVEDRLDPTTLNIPGTASSQANEMMHEHFGDSAPFAILLRGPAKAIDRQGPALVRALRQDPAVTTLSPWDRGSVSRLRPDPRRALILADFHVDTKTAVNETVPELNEILEQEIHAPVRVTQTGFATLSAAIQDESIAATERGELIALPFLLVILLLVFRSPIAAAIPLAFGAITVVASRGILYFFTSWFDIDAFALTVCSMMGLALGVDYALLMVSRFREELAAGTEPIEAARRTRRTAGRTTIFAGSTLLISMLTALFILPGSLLASLAGTVMMVVILSVTVATVVGPALLVLIGGNVDRWRIGKAPGEGTSKLMAVVSAALRRPALAAVLIGGLLLVLAAPTLGLKTGPPSVEELPKDAVARQDAELVDKAIGPGWDAPFQVIAVNEDGPITGAKSLAALEHFQNQVAALPGVQAVIGPTQATKRVEPLQELGNAALSSEGNIGPVKQLGKLGRSLAVAAGGVAQLRDGITEASDGAGLLALGADRAGEGAELIAVGLGRAANGSEQAITALEKFAKGSKRLAEAEGTAAVGGLQLKLSTRSLIPNLRNTGLKPALKAEKNLEKEVNETLPKLIAPAKAADEELKKAMAELQAMTVGQTDPKYAAALEAVRKATAAVSGTDPVSGAPYAAEYTGLPTELEAQQARLLEDLNHIHTSVGEMKSLLINLKKVSNGAEKLDEGLFEIHAAGNKLAHGAAKLFNASKSLGTGLSKLSSGATALVGGIDRLGGGAEALEAGLAEGAEKSAPLQAGLAGASVRVIAGKARIRRQAGRVRAASPGLFNSGYFVLSALDGAPPRVRSAAGSTVDLRSGQAASVLVISKFPFNSDGSIALNKRLDTETAELGKKASLETGVAGSVSQLNDYSRVTRERIPFVVAAITLVTFLVLIVVLRAVLLAAIAVALNLLTVGVAFGILTLLFYVPDDWPLGGHTYVDAVGAVMIFGIVFGLSIDYAVFLLSRMREHYDEEGDHAAAIKFGLDKTAGVITGAAAIMMAVFIAFAGAPIATVSQLGIGLTIAVILDATVVRIVLLPALMLLIGDRVWWLPRGLARRLPKLSV